MAVPLCSLCYKPLFLPPGFAGALCRCATPSAPTPGVAPAPSPAPAAPGGPSLRVSEGLQDGGRGARDGASGSPGRGREERSQPSPQGSRGPIEAAPKPEGLDDAWKPDRDILERAEAWFTTRFFKKGGIGDNDWKPLVAACKTWGMPKDAKWRDWLREQWETVRLNAVRVLITAKAIESKTAPPELKALYEAIKARGSATLTLADIQAKIDPKATQAQLDKLLDLALIYEPKVDGGYTAVV